ncbi:trihelix transcription factor DF1-like [Salvia hispanica]|uniref:trihelix transcription factor DF1-like n=1 Tax=Salvia hispanica TaxID=49212 RepID=UPI002009A50F|nr:trihelix transcription factor DF1-like [Salvia hispanica]
MMLGVSGLISPSAAVAENHESGGASGGSSEVGAAASSVLASGADENEKIGGGGGGNRWPRQETLALLKIRSDMDVTFRDASLKGPLWEEVSRKMAELGFQRSAKKCKEKFENVFKYHKRTKDGRASKQDAKAYRFFDQLEALENTSPNNHHFNPPPPPAMPTPVASASPTPLSVVPPKNISVGNPNPNPNPIITSSSSSPFQLQSHQQQQQQQQLQQIPPYFSNSTSSSTSSDEDIQRRSGRKRKWKEYLEKLMTDVVQKQEDLQKKFLEALERRERDRIAREEAWRVQEMARMNREHELLLQERSVAAAKDAAVISFLQKVTGQSNLQIPNFSPMPPPHSNPNPIPNPNSNPNSNPAPAAELNQIQIQQKAASSTPLEITPHRDNNGGGDDHISPSSSSRWPKAEVEALIKLRKDLEVKYQENGPKGPLWEEISKAMSGIGYCRSSKRCKEKWENINKYFKKVKESNKKRPEDSKTCPYFHQLDAMYKERAKSNVPSFNLGPIMARPEQQWPQQMHDQNHDNESENHDEGDENEDEDEEVGDYEMIATKQPASSVTNAVEGG